LKMVDYPTIENNNVSTRPELISGISLINVSELYLIAADALLSTNYDMALKYFNDEIRSRGLSPLIAGQTLTSERIFNEYRKETFCEGLHWFNMKRLNRDILSNAESRTIPANDDIYVLPIPEEEMEYRPEANNNQ
ncbi:RagB/SusD family nutrient uptake outer membrane protein, partial [uncultured Duncaniella sp.]